MSSSANPQHEPTMEEILASIRKIISEDQPEAAKPAPQPSPARQAPAPMPPQASADVLDLTEEVQEEEPLPPIPAAPPPVEDDIVFESVDAEPKYAAPEDHDSLISDSTRGAMGRVLANLDGDLPVDVAPPSGNSLEALFTRAVQDALRPALRAWVDDHRSEIMEHLRPMIRDWMDENLPRLIEAAVVKELGRAASARQRRY